MAVTGLISNRTYNEAQIFDAHVYTLMKAEPLSNAEGALVVPVRKKTGPHFRRIGNATFRTRIGRTETDRTHKRVVSWLKKNLQANRVKIVTRVFADNGSSDSSKQSEYEEQVIFFSPDDYQYKWFSENECRIAFVDGGYIVPDIAGRDLTVFSPSAGHETVIIEVIQTHYPERDTFFRLLSLSSVGHLVIFYFVAPDKWESKFNHYRDKDSGIVELRPAYYLAQGHVFKNGVEWKQHKNESDEEWYTYLESSYFNHPMKNK